MLLGVFCRPLVRCFRKRRHFLLGFEGLDGFLFFVSAVKNAALFETFTSNGEGISLKEERE
jgi:hypothetical protein